MLAVVVVRVPTSPQRPGRSAAMTGVSDVDAVEAMSRPALLALWSELLGGTPPQSMSQPLLRRVLAWELQARAQGGLPAALRRRLDALAEAHAKVGSKNGGTSGAQARSPRMRPGGRLLREWAGVTHVVDVVEGGYLWRGERHRSLSAIARAITGAHWSGPRFFGLNDANAGAGGSVSGSRGRSPSKPTSYAKRARAA